MAEEHGVGHRSQEGGADERPNHRQAVRAARMGPRQHKPHRPDQRRDQVEGGPKLVLGTIDPRMRW